jgi:hypothetical protein
VRVAVEETARRGGDARELAPRAGEVRVRFEDLVLRPGPFERARGAELAEFRERAARRRTRAQRRLDERRDLHRERARAAEAAVSNEVERGGTERPPVEAAVCPEATILGGDERREVVRRDAVERCPREAAAVAVDAAFVQHGAVTIEQQGLAAREARAHRLDRRERRRRGRALPQSEQQDERDREPAAPRHGAISSVSFGRSPMRSGA